jgi:cytochrome c-type biogenesis protein CcmH
MSARQLVRTALVVVAAGLLVTSPAPGQQAIDKAASEIFGTVMSPFCPGMTIATCPSSQAAELRDEIRAKLAAGATKDEVLDELYAEWGEEVLGPRSATGMGLLAWLVPALAIVVGAAGLTMWLRVSSSRVRTAGSSGESIDPKAELRLREELARL